MSDKDCRYVQWSHIERGKKLHYVIGVFTSCRARFVAEVSRENVASIFGVEEISASKVKLELSLTILKPGYKLDVSSHLHVRLHYPC
jgi:hypothetical protein